MTVEFNHDSIMKMYEAKRKKFLTMTGHQGVAIAAEQVGRDGRIHWDTGASSNAKKFIFDGDDTIQIIADMEYDIYNERRYGIMKIMEDKLKPYINKFMVAVFG